MQRGVDPMRRSTSHRSRYKWVLVSALLFGVIPAPGFAESDAEQWLYRAEVVFESAEYSWLVRLSDGTKFLLGWSERPCKEVTAWKSGRALIYAYDEVVGPVLIDSQTGCHMSVPNPDPHPIDLIDVFPEDRTLYDLWDAELNRVYKLAMKMLGPLDGSHAQDGPEVDKALRESQLRWIAFRDAESEALRALHAGNGQVGRQQEMQQVVDLIRQRARSLVHYVSTER